MIERGWGEPGKVTPLDDRLWQIDLGFRGREGIISAYLLAGAEPGELPCRSMSR